MCSVDTDDLRTVHCIITSMLKTCICGNKDRLQNCNTYYTQPDVRWLNKKNGMIKVSIILDMCFWYHDIQATWNQGQVNQWGWIDIEPTAGLRQIKESSYQGLFL